MEAKLCKFAAAIGLAVVFLLAASGCKTTPQAQARQPTGIEQAAPVVCSDFPEAQVHQVVMIFIDVSRSVRRDLRDQLAKILADASRLVRRLPPCTLVFVRYISEQSYQDSERSLSAVIPEEPAPLHCQPFDLHCHREEQQRKARVRCVDEARERLAAAIQSLAPARANKTDVWGAIAAASDLLSAYPQSQRFVVIYSDLIDTVGTRLPSRLPGLERAKIITRIIKNDDPVELAQRLSAFSARLAKWGAAVQSIPFGVDGPAIDDLFVQQPAAANVPLALEQTQLQH